MFENISIIGGGLIGSSILRAINKNKIAQKVSIFDKSKEVLSFLKQENFNVNICKNMASAVKDSEMIIIATPLSSYKEILFSLKTVIKKDTILTDTGSVKKEINKIIENFNLKDISWIASHPIAGTEDSGPKAGSADLFKNRWCIICPAKNSKKKDVLKVEKFWQQLGSKVKSMSIEEHDHILSLTSHLPHAIAYNIVKTAINDKDKFKQDVIHYSAGGLRDFTRIAASDPIMWRDIFIDNSENILEVLDNFSYNLDLMKKAIKDKNGNELVKIFLSTKEVRKEIIKAGQDTKKPDFGRKKD
jgi:cyclohexadieny/prephenate dehydrogenase